MSETAIDTANDPTAASHETGPDITVPDITVPDVDQDSTAREVIRAAVARSVRIFLAELPGTQTGDDPEHLHQARVAVRRLRSDLRTFGPLLDTGWSDPLRDELSWLGGSLGSVRDLDVLLLLLDDLGAEPSLHPDELARLVDRFRTRRDVARTHLLADLAGGRAARLAVAMVDAARDPRTAPQADDPAGELLPPLAARPWHKIERAVERLGPEPADTELHRVRILAKRCRYASDAVAPAVGKPARRLARAMADVQTCLGDLNDAVVIGHRLREIAREEPDVAFVAGQISALLARRAAHCRADFPAVWADASRPKLRSWF